MLYPLWFSFIDTKNSQDSRVKEGTIFIPLYHLHLLTNRQAIFICRFAFSPLMHNIPKWLTWLFRTFNQSTSNYQYLTQCDSSTSALHKKIKKPLMKNFIFCLVLGITIWWNISWILLVDFMLHLITVIFRR